MLCAAGAVCDCCFSGERHPALRAGAAGGWRGLRPSSFWGILRFDARNHSRRWQGDSSLSAHEGDEQAPASGRSGADDLPLRPPAGGRRTGRDTRRHQHGTHGRDRERARVGTGIRRQPDLSRARAGPRDRPRVALGEAFSAGGPVAVLLGDNIFAGPLAPFVKSFRESPRGRAVLLKRVSDPERYGVAAPRRETDRRD